MGGVAFYGRWQSVRKFESVGKCISGCMCEKGAVGFNGGFFVAVVTSIVLE